MVLNAEKRRQLAAVALQLKVAPGPSTADASAPTTSSPDLFAPTPVDQRQKGVVEAAASEDEDTCSDLAFKRKRKVDVAIPANLASDDRAPSYREHPPSVSSPRDLVVQEGRGKSASGADREAPLADLPAFLQRALQSFQNQERLENMEEDPLLEHASKCLGDILVASSLTLFRMQKARKAASQEALEVKDLKRLETALYLEAADLRQSELTVRSHG